MPTPSEESLVGALARVAEIQPRLDAVTLDSDPGVEARLAGIESDISTIVQAVEALGALLKEHLASGES